MKKKTIRKSPLLRLGKVLLLSAPLLISCETSSNAEPPPAAETAEGALVAANSGDKDADMKEVILNVFGMT